MRASPLSDSKTNRLQSRREFLGITSAAALGLVLSAEEDVGAAETGLPATPKSLVGSNIYVWTQYAQRAKKPFDVEDVISALRDTGYDYLEGFMDVKNPDQNAREHRLARRFSVEIALEPATTITRSPIEDHRISREFVRQVFGS